MKKIVPVILILFCLSAIQDKSSIIKIDLLVQVKSVITNLSEIAMDLDYFPLETIDNSLIDKITSIKVREKFLYIGTLDKLFCFNTSGKYLFKLDKKGRGPEEYEYLKDFDVNLNNTILAVKVRSTIILYKQSDTGFVFIKKLPLLSTPSKINFTDESNNLMLQYSNTDGTKPYAMELIDLKGKQLFRKTNYLKFILKDGIIVSSIYENTSYWLNNTLFLKELQNDTLFIVTKNKSIEPYIILDSKNKRLTAEVRSTGFYYSNHMHEYIILQKVLESNKYLYYKFSYNNENQAYIYDKETKAKYCIPIKTYLKDDIIGGMNFEPQYSNNGIFYMWVDAINLKRYFSDEGSINKVVKNPEKSNALKKLVNAISENDNPVIIIVKMK